MSVNIDAAFGNAPARPQVFPINLGDGMGVGDLATVADGFLVLSGPEADKAGEADLFFWDGRSAAPARLGMLGGVADHAKPEAVLVLAEDMEVRAWVWRGIALGRSQAIAAAVLTAEFVQPAKRHIAAARRHRRRLQLQHGDGEIADTSSACRATKRSRLVQEAAESDAMVVVPNSLSGAGARHCVYFSTASSSALRRPVRSSAPNAALRGSSTSNVAISSILMVPLPVVMPIR